jgi:DNA-binding Lrp family transcriptional regulator
MYIGTGGILGDPGRAAELRDQRLPPTVLPGFTTLVLDLSGMTPTPAALRELIVPLGQRLRGGVYGTAKLILATPDDAVAEVVDLLASAHGLPIFLARSSSPEDVARARPAGDLTTTDHQTLEGLAAAGGLATVADLAGRFGIEPTAVNNRLANLDRKGYLYRYHRPRRSGDVYLDPRAPFDIGAYGAPPSREALKAAGIETDPYDRSALRLEGEAAQRAAELLGAREKHRSDT